MTHRRPSRLRLAALLLPLLVAACGGAALPSIPPLTPAPTATPPTHPGPTYPPGCPTSQPAALSSDATRTVTAVTPKGTIVIVIKGAGSPIATGNFVALVACGYYDNVVFHRLVPGFVIQGGDGEFGRAPDVIPGLVGSGGPPYTIQDEPVTVRYARGVVAMARTVKANSANSQFFIVLDDTAEQALASANTYQILGTVTAGMDVVDTIAAMPNSGSPDNAAIDPVPMTKVTVTTP
jgi:cyclophilin family peptidyl-prolyl cis-trans isomerase